MNADPFAHRPRLKQRFSGAMLSGATNFGRPALSELRSARSRAGPGHTMKRLAIVFLFLVPLAALGQDTAAPARPGPATTAPASEKQPPAPVAATTPPPATAAPTSAGSMTSSAHPTPRPAGGAATIISIAESG